MACEMRTLVAVRWFARGENRFLFGSDSSPRHARRTARRCAEVSSIRSRGRRRRLDAVALGSAARGVHPTGSSICARALDARCALRDAGSRSRSADVGRMSSPVTVLARDASAGVRVCARHTGARRQVEAHVSLPRALVGVRAQRCETREAATVRRAAASLRAGAIVIATRETRSFDRNRDSRSLAHLDFVRLRAGARRHDEQHRRAHADEHDSA
jgi:hypothetical protein